jgi:hypothetical protein
MEKIPSNENSEKTEEQARAETAEKVVSFLEKTEVYEKLEELLDGQKDKISFEEFKDLLVRLNGIIRDIPIHERHFDGAQVHVEGWMDTYKPPRQKDKEGLLERAYNSTDKVEEGDEKYLIPAVINAVHLFVDGNGRTARLLYQLLEKHKSKEEFLIVVEKAMKKDGRYDTFNVNPGLIASQIEDIVYARHGWNPEHTRIGEFRSGFITMEMEKIDQDHPSHAVLKELVKESKADATLMITALNEVATKDQSKKILANDGRISLIKMSEVLSTEELEEVIEKFWEIKKEYVDILVDIFVHPDEYKTMDDKQEIKVKDLFIKKVKAEAEMK